MRICIDLDGVIADFKNENESYSDVKPIKGAAKKIKALKESGHYIIIYSARNMKTQNGNLGKVIANVGQITINWLNKNNIVYDEIYFGKPWADIYIDDNAIRFESWKDIKDDAKNLPISSEMKRKKST